MVCAADQMITRVMSHLACIPSALWPTSRPLLFRTGSRELLLNPLRVGWVLFSDPTSRWNGGVQCGVRDLLKKVTNLLFTLLLVMDTTSCDGSHFCCRTLRHDTVNYDAKLQVKLCVTGTYIPHLLWVTSHIESQYKVLLTIDTSRVRIGYTCNVRDCGTVHSKIKIPCEVLDSYVIVSGGTNRNNLHLMGRLDSAHYNDSIKMY